MATPEATAAKAHSAQQLVLQQIRLLGTPEDAQYIEDAALVPNIQSEPDYLAAEQLERIGEVLVRVNRRRNDPGAEDQHEADTDIEALDGIDRGVANVLRHNGYYTKGELSLATDEELLALDGIGPNRLQTIRDQVGYIGDEQEEPEEPEEPTETADENPSEEESGDREPGEGTEGDEGTPEETPGGSPDAADEEDAAGGETQEEAEG